MSFIGRICPLVLLYEVIWNDKLTHINLMPIGVSEGGLQFYNECKLMAILILPSNLLTESLQKFS